MSTDSVSTYSTDCQRPADVLLTVTPNDAKALNLAAQAAPLVSNRAYYEDAMQQRTWRHVADAAPSAFGHLIERIKQRLLKPPYIVWVRGLRFDPGNRLFVAINRAFGPLVARPYQKPRAQLVHYLQSKTDLRTATAQGYESEKLHTDTADWQTPVRLISMVCLQPDVGGGGLTRVLDLDSVCQHVMARLGQAALERLRATPVAWKLASYRGNGFSLRPILSKNAICWRNYTIDRAQTAQHTGGSILTDLIDQFGQLVDQAPSTIEFLMQKQDFLMIDNHRVLHARSPLSQHSGKTRLMVRSWIQ